MHAGKLVFAQVMEFAPWHTFRRLVTKYDGDFNVRRFSCLDQFLCLAFAQLTYRESLRDIETCLRAQSAKLYHLGIRGSVARSHPGTASVSFTAGRGKYRLGPSSTRSSTMSTRSAMAWPAYP